ncbi:MAG: response regulator [Mariprofundaceae bacterium]|nr:response regulator [Mariprofundaceae bacterium]
MIHIVDDNPLVLDVMVELVGLFGFKIRHFASSQDYLDYATSDNYQQPIAVFCDVMMPGLDGFELMNRVHARYPHCRFIIMSGDDSTSHRDKRGACIYLLKPIHFKTLERVFNHLRICRECGPSHSLADTWADDRNFFDVTDTRCPFLSDKDI